MNHLELLDALELQIWTADPSGLLTFVNTYTANYFGRTREQLVGEGWFGSNIDVDAERRAQEVLRAGRLPLHTAFPAA